MTRSKLFFWLVGLSFVIFSCGTGKVSMSEDLNSKTEETDRIRIANDSLEYEIIIIEPGFNNWLLSQPKQGYHSQVFLETKNQRFTVEYNNRVLNSYRYPRGLYEERIDYDPTVDYGYEVNYLLYNYFIYFQEKYKQHFIGNRN